MTIANTVIGFPGETEQTAHQTIRFIKELNPDSVGFYVATPYPGTPMYEQVKEKGWLKDGEYNELLVTGKVAIEKAIKLTQTSSESEGTVSTFIEGIREILHTTCVLGPEPRMNEEERRTFRTKICIGEDREDEGQVLIFPHKSVEQVSKLYQNKISISVRSLGRDLFEQKFLLESRSSGSPSVIKRVGEGGKALSVWVFDRTKLFGITEEEKEENENSLANNEKVEDELFDEPNNPNKMQDK
jgi:hypothetical protein